MSSFARRPADASVIRRAVLFLLLASALAASAQTVLIGPGVRSGDFEADGDPTSPTRTFAQTLYWYNVGTGGQTQPATYTNLFYAGARRLGIAESALRKAAQDTGHTISAGDWFSVSYFWRDDWRWHANDQIAIKLFTTDNDLANGTPTTFETLLSGAKPLNSTYVSASGVATAFPGQVGKRLFVMIDTKDGGTNGGEGFACLDNFTLTVTNSNKLIESVVHYSPALQNGGFESAVGSTTRNWGTGLNVTSCSRNGNTNYIAPQGAAMLNINTSGGVGGLQNTGHVVRKGQTFSLAFDWSSATSWVATNSISWRLLTTSNNATNGAQTAIASGSVSGKTGDGTQWGTSLVLPDGGTVTDPSIGKELWVEIRATTTSGGTRFAFLDKVILTANTPRPKGTILVVR